MNITNITDYIKQRNNRKILRGIIFFYNFKFVH